ncbi:MAG: class I SAM-dependent methyltransferase, partial [bacterium]|nr:class I SAM-dependent methyltransferase [bacterium]
GHFIRNIKARRRLAVDLSPHVLELKKYGIEVMNIPAGEIAGTLNEPADAVFMSNFLEHMPTKRIMLDVLKAAWDTLRPGGKLIILQPNIRYAGASYWDYIDHHIALTEHSLCEALEISGFSVEKCIPRFLPYTVKSGVGAVAASSHTATMVSWYLKLPILWRIFGAQTFVIARRLP